MSCSPTVRIGFIALIASCTTIPISAPRSAAQSFGLMSESSRPSQRIEPVVRALVPANPKMERASTLFPDPDSPISAWMRPGATARSTPWRTSVAPKATRRFRISRIGAGREEGSDAAEESGAGTPPGIGGIVMRRKTSKGLGKEEMRTARVRGARTALSALPARSAGVRPGGGQRGYLKLSTSAERSSEP